MEEKTQVVQAPVPTQEELDAAGGIYDKLMLLKPEKYTDLSDRTLSILFSKVSKPYCCYNTDYKRWMFYNGTHWEIDSSGVKIRQVTNRFAYEFLHYAMSITNSEEDPFYKFAHDLGDASKRNSLIKDSIDKNTVSEKDLDKDIYLINLKNGTYDLKRMELRQHSYKDMITKMANAEYTPGTQSDTLDKFMDDIFCGDQELIQYMYRVLGLCLSGETSPEAFWIFLGETTRNGKSTLMSTFSYMLGGPNGYAMNCDISSLAKKKYYNGSSPSSDIARLKGARFVVASEPPKDFQLDEAKIKALTGGDRVTARMLRCNDIEYQPMFKIFIGTNHRPAISDDSILNSNRIRIVPFLKHFNEDEQNQNLKEILKAPQVINALFMKSLDGWQQYKNIGLNEPTIVKEAVAEYKTSGQVFNLFFESTFEPCEGNMISLTEFYPLYEAWCTENDFVIVNKHEVIGFMRSIGVFKARATINGYTHRNILANYKYRSTVAPTPNINKPHNNSDSLNTLPDMSSFSANNTTQPSLIDDFMSSMGFDFPTPADVQKNDPQTAPNQFENHSVVTQARSVTPDQAPF